jgi:hypothetical protein
VSPDVDRHHQHLLARPPAAQVPADHQTEQTRNDGAWIGFLVIHVGM